MAGVARRPAARRSSQFRELAAGKLGARACFGIHIAGLGSPTMDSYIQACRSCHAGFRSECRARITESLGYWR